MSANFGIITGFPSCDEIVRLQILSLAGLSLVLPLFNAAFAESVVISDWQPWAQLPDSERQQLAPSCPGGYVAVPVTTVTENTRFQFDQATYDPNTSMDLNGNVSIQSGGLSSHSERLRYWPDTEAAELSGDVSLRLPEVSFSSANAEISLQNYYTQLKEAQFVLHDQDIRGKAAQLERTGEQQFAARSIAFTRCVPSSNAWQIKSSTLKVDTDEGVARAWNARLEIHNVPVLYVPYISFPLNDQPRTGFLMPTFGSSYTQPYYLHLAPNYDDTLQADLSVANGVLLSNEFRFLTENHNGINEVDYRLLEGDAVSTTAERWALQHRQSGQFGRLGYDINTRWVSDRNFDTEYNSAISPTQNQSAKLSLIYNTALLNNSLSLSYLQPVEDSVQADGNYLSKLDTQFKTQAKPYTASLRYQQQQVFAPAKSLASAADFDLIRQPELQLSRTALSLPVGFQMTPALSLTRFSRGLDSALLQSLTDPEKPLATETDRAVATLNAKRPLSAGTISITPSIDVWQSLYRLDNPTDVALDQTQYQQSLWRAAADMKLNLKMSSETLDHEFSPRLYYAYAPLQTQTAPLLDSNADSSFKLFTNSRFSGYDRIGDMNRLSGSLGYALSGVGKDDPLLTAAIDKGIKLSQERVQEAGVDAIDADWQPEFSDWIGRMGLQANNDLRFEAQANLDHEENRWNSFRLSADYQPAGQSFARVTFSRRVPTDEDATTHRITTGGYVPLTNSLALIGYANASADVANENLSASAFGIDQMLIGIDIESCCWALRLATMEIAADDDDSNSLFPVSSERKYYFEVTLRGLGNGFGTIEEILNSLDFGYSGRQFNYR